MKRQIGQKLSKQTGRRNQSLQTDNPHRIGQENPEILILNYHFLALLKALEHILQDNGLYLDSDSILFK